MPPCWFKVRDAPPYVAVGFALIAQHRAQFEYNHLASLEALNAAGGLDFTELYCGLTDRPLFPSPPIALHAQREAVLRMISGRLRA